jgi:hypothetical protein
MGGLVIKEYQLRKEIIFEDYCPEYMEFYKFCEDKLFLR